MIIAGYLFLIILAHDVINIILRQVGLLSVDLLKILSEKSNACMLANIEAMRTNGMGAAIPISEWFKLLLSAYLVNVVVKSLIEFDQPLRA